MLDFEYFTVSCQECEKEFEVDIPSDVSADGLGVFKMSRVAEAASHALAGASLMTTNGNGRRHGVYNDRIAID